MDGILADANNFDLLRSRRFLKRLKSAEGKAKRGIRKAEKAITLGSSYRTPGNRFMLGHAIYSRAGIKRAKRSVDLTARALRIKRLRGLIKNKKALRVKGLSNRRAEREYRKWHKKTYGGSYISESERSLRR